MASARTEQNIGADVIDLVASYDPGEFYDESVLIKYVVNNINPEDLKEEGKWTPDQVFSDEELLKWADDNGYMEHEDDTPNTIP